MKRNDIGSGLLEHFLMRTVVVTGFHPYGGHSVNPALEVMQVMEGKAVNGARVVGRGLPVSFRDIKKRIGEILEEFRPVAVISLGHCPGESVIRLERLGVNLADFDIADNEGAILRDVAISSNGPQARFSTLPLPKIEHALLDAGIPARLSASAGTFLCNACLYCFLEAADRCPPAPACGFIHLPYLPQQVAEHMASVRRQGRGKTEQRADLPSMDLSTGVRAVEIAIRETLLSRAEPRRSC
jgi:pyroglutamyl-peptidase